MKRKNNILYTIDWFTIGLYLLLILLGWINIYAAVFKEEHSSIFDISQQYGKQLIWMVTAVIIAFLTIIIESKFFSFFAYPIYAFFLFILLLVPFIGTEIYGSTSWLKFGNIYLQPSEFTKIATALALARYLSSYNITLKSVKSIIIAFAIIFLPVLLILLQPDLGSAIIFISFIIVLYREGLHKYLTIILFLIPALFVLTLMLNNTQTVLLLLGLSILFFCLLRQRGRDIVNIILIITPLAIIVYLFDSYDFVEIKRYYLMLLAVGMLVIIFFIIAIAKKIPQFFIVLIFFISSLAYTYSAGFLFDNVLKEHQQNRINIMLGIESDPLGKGYNVNQSMIAIGSGGFSGKGFLQGTQTKFDFVPKQSTDFIFCTIGEEWGFIGTSFVVMLFLIFLLRLIIIAERQRSVFSRVYGYGVFVIFLFHVVINISMTIGLFPVIGIPLPFFSYGGSSLWAFTIFLFILINLDSRRYNFLV